MSDQKVYKSEMGTGKTLEFNPGAGFRITPGHLGLDGGAVGIFLSKEDVTDLGEAILQYHAPERLAPKGPKLDDRFKVGDWVKRGGTDFGDAVEVLDVRPFTAEERQVCFLVPAEAVRVYYKTADGRRYPIASNLLVPAEAPKPPRAPLSDQVGKFYRHTEYGDLVRITGEAKSVLSAQRQSGLDWAEAEREDGRKTNIFVHTYDTKEWWEPVEVEEKTVWVAKD